MLELASFKISAPSHPPHWRYIEKTSKTRPILPQFTVIRQLKLTANSIVIILRSLRTPKRPLGRTMCEKRDFLDVKKNVFLRRKVNHYRVKPIDF